jgi:glycosyltransferase involved in cell wall biosynthesis
MTRLLVIVDSPHYVRQGQVVGREPRVRESTYLAAAFGSVTLLAPLHRGTAPPNTIPYTTDRMSLQPVRPLGGTGLGRKAHGLLALPGYALAIRRAMARADLVHVRCPSVVGLAACLVLALDRRVPRWSQYLSNWRPDQRDPWSYTFQRRWLERGLTGGPVVINGRWPDQPGHVHSFVNPCLTETEVQEGSAASAGKRLREPIRLLFVGRLVAAKGGGRALDILAGLVRRGRQACLDVVGDGAHRPRFEALAAELGVTDKVRFHGVQARVALNEFYRHAHVMLLPSASEGWPKVLSEGMAYGAVPVAGAVSSIPQVLADTGAGLALPPLDIRAYVEAIDELLRDPARWEEMSRKSLEAAPAFTYEVYVRRLFGMLRASRIPV